jgi:acyl-CoA reductase-like NAD-dependent aldehyde dehydrogenase
MAISVLVAVGDVADRVVPMMRERMTTLRVGDGRRSCDMGPLITPQHREKVASYIDIAIQDAAEVVVDGRNVKADGAKGGFWLGPTPIDRVPLTSRVYTDEIFGPVLSVVRVKSFDEGVKLINSGAFGNGAAIFTNDGGAGRRFQNEIEVGMIGLNVPIPAQLPTIRSAVLKIAFSATPKRTGCKVSTSSLARKRSPRGGPIHRMAESTWVFPTPDRVCNSHVVPRISKLIHNA